MTNAKVHQGLRDDKKVEESTINTGSNIKEKEAQSNLEQ